jgi:hypothetical protein
MDSIDIADATFSLGNYDVDGVMTMGGGAKDYTTFIYIGVAILVVVLGTFLYKMYVNKKNNEHVNMDCEGGFCTMAQRPT